MTQRNITIFYSWQSDLPPKSNRNLIREGLEKAKSTLEDKYSDINITLDEATNNETGSPDIIETILKKLILAIFTLQT